MATAANNLRTLFERGGYIRRPNLDRLEELGSQRYKKGSEVRLVLLSNAELREAKRWLKDVGLRVGKPFAKHSRIVLPIYGDHAVDWFESNRRKARR